MSPFATSRHTDYSRVSISSLPCDREIVRCATVHASGSHDPQAAIGSFSRTPIHHIRAAGHQPPFRQASRRLRCEIFSYFFLAHTLGAGSQLIADIEFGKLFGLFVQNLVFNIRIVVNFDICVFFFISGVKQLPAINMRYHLLLPIVPF